MTILENIDSLRRIVGRWNNEFMPRYLVTTRRSMRDSAISARGAMESQPGVVLEPGDNPDMVTIEADEATVDRLKETYKDTHFIEPEIQRGLH